MGIRVPIVPGIMPIQNFSQLARFSDMCGAEIPRWMRLKLEGLGDDTASIKAFGLDVVTDICDRLLSQGAPGLHFYTMNQATLSAEIWTAPQVVKPLAAAVLAGLALELGVLHWMTPLENRLLDTFVKRHAAALSPDPDIVLVNIDEKSLASMEKEAGRWPWSRAVYVDLLEGLAAQKPRAIVFDIMFVERDSFRPQDDAAFGETAAKVANAYFPFLRLPRSADPRESASPTTRAISAWCARRPPTRRRPSRWCRRSRCRRRLCARRADHFPTTPTVSAAATCCARRWADGRSPRSRRAWRATSAFRCPTRTPGARLARTRGQLPARLVLRPVRGFTRSGKKRPANEFTGKIVIVGTAATGLHDLRVTPMHSTHPGAEILGTAIENLKNGRAMHYAPPWWAAAAASRCSPRSTSRSTRSGRAHLRRRARRALPRGLAGSYPRGRPLLLVPC